MLVIIGSRLDGACPITKWPENQYLSHLWTHATNPVFKHKGGFYVKVPDSILRQAKDASLPVTMRIGKSGLTDAVAVELEGQLSSRTLVKAKVNRGLFPREEMKRVWTHLADQTSSHVVFARKM